MACWSAMLSQIDIPDHAASLDNSLVRPRKKARARDLSGSNNPVYAQQLAYLFYILVDRVFK